MSNSGKLLVGLVVLAILGVLGIHLDGLGLVARGHGSARQAEQILTQAARTALTEAQIDWAQVRLSGQKAVLEGMAPSPEARDRAIDVVRGAVCVRPDQCGGLIVGGITVVDHAGLAVASAPLDALVWQASYQRGEPLFLEGGVLSDTMRDRVVGEATTLFPDGVKDAMALREAAAVPNWLSAARAQLAALALLESGRIEAEGSRFVLTGVALDEDAKQKAEALLASLPDDIEATVSISLADPEPASIAPKPEPEVEPLPATTASVDVCQEEFDKTMREGVINFRFKSAALPDDSLSLLDRLAQTALKCARLRIEVAGHTDNNGTVERNQRLSEARAQSVVDHLVAQGVPADRIAARGYSEERPVASNETEKGRAANRRIEFTVSLDSEQ